MIDLHYNTCFFCRGIGEEKMSMFFIGCCSISYYHKSCWAWRTCEDIRFTKVFKNFEEWRLYAGDEWDFTERIYVDQHHTRHYWKKSLRHRVNGPAQEFKNGTKFWWEDGKRHRLDGPAEEWPNGVVEWWIEGNMYTEQPYKAEIAKRYEDAENYKRIMDLR